MIAVMLIGLIVVAIGHRSNKVSVTAQKTDLVDKPKHSTIPMVITKEVHKKKHGDTVTIWVKTHGTINY